MTILNTMILIGLAGLTMHLQLYWMAAIVGAIFAGGIWLGRRKARRAARAALRG
jgi:hypothetical protein